MYTVNGPRPKEEKEIGTLPMAHHGGPEFAVDWNASTEDNNDNKAFGLRLGYSPTPSAEFGFSHTNADADEDLCITLTMIDFSLMTGNFEIRSEYLKQDTVDFSAAAIAAGAPEIPPEDTEGYYVQVSKGSGCPSLMLALAPWRTPPACRKSDRNGCEFLAGEQPRAETFRCAG